MRRGDVYYATPPGKRNGFPIVLLSIEPGQSGRINGVKVTRSLFHTGEFDIHIEATGVDNCYARCDTLEEIPVDWLGDYVGTCDTAEMHDIGQAVAYRLGLYHG